METTNFINSLGSADLQSFINVLDAYNSDYRTRIEAIENIGFNKCSGDVYLSLESSILITSCFGRSVDYVVINSRNGEESYFDTYTEALNYQNGEEEEEEEEAEI